MPPLLGQVHSSSQYVPVSAESPVQLGGYLVDAPGLIVRVSYCTLSAQTSLGIAKGTGTPPVSSELRADAQHTTKKTPRLFPGGEINLLLTKLVD
jgi:hypothetical protein